MSRSLQKIFDTHCHIGLRKGPAGSVMEQVLRAHASNVMGLCVVGIDPFTSIKAQKIASHIRTQLDTTVSDTSSSKESINTSDDQINMEKDSSSSYCPVLYSAGIHPHSAELCRSSDQWRVIKELVLEGKSDGTSSSSSSLNREEKERNKKEHLPGAQEPSALLFVPPAAVGETGLDYFKSRASSEDQAFNLEQHVKLAKQTKLPIILHCRNAYEDMYTQLKPFAPLHGVVHCFSSDAKWMEKFIELGLFISFCNTVTYERSYKLREAARVCPIEKMVVETDAPYLPPARVLQQGSRRGGGNNTSSRMANEPMYTADVVHEVARLRGETVGHIAQATWKNSHKLFNLELKE